MLLICLLVATGATVASGAQNGLREDLANKVRISNVTTAHVDTAAGHKGNHQITARDFATSNELRAAKAKAKPKTNNIILGVILTSFFILVFVNMLALSNNSRLCNNCGFTGSMRPFVLSEKKLFNSVLVPLVRFFPLLLYIYAEKGRFMCPRCFRTAANVTVKSKLRTWEK